LRKVGKNSEYYFRLISMYQETVPKLCFCAYLCKFLLEFFTRCNIFYL